MAISTTTIVVLLAVSLFILGLVIGWIFADDYGGDTTKKKLKTLIALSVTIVWIAAVLADILIAGYTVSPLLHAIMGAIVGYFFTEDGVNFNVVRGDNDK